MVQYLLFWLFHNSLSICIYLQVNKAQPRVSICSCQDPFVAPQDYQHLSDCQLMFRFFSPVNLSHSHLQFLSLLLVDGIVLIGISLRVQEEYVYIQPTSAWVNFMEPNNHLRVHGDIFFLEGCSSDTHQHVLLWRTKFPYWFS